MAHSLPGPIRTVKLFQYLLWLCFLALVIFTCFVLFSDTRHKQIQGLAIDSQDNFYIADSGNAVITKYDSQRKPLVSWGVKGSANGQFAERLGLGELALGPQNELYVIDKGNFRVQKFDSNGNFLAKWGSQGSGPGQFEVPEKIAVSGQGQVYVWDKAVKKFDANGNYLGLLGENLPQKEQLNGSNGLAVDSAGNVYVAGNSPKQIFKFDTQGQLVQSLLIRGLDPDLFSYSRSLAVDRQGNFYISGSESVYFVKIDPTGKFLFGAPVDRDSNNFPLSQIALDSLNNVNILNRTETRVDIFDNNGRSLNKWTIGWPRWLVIYLPLLLATLSFLNLGLSNLETSLKKKYGLLKPTRSKRNVILTAPSLMGKISQFINMGASIVGLLVSSILFGVSSRLLPAGFISPYFEAGNVVLDLSAVLLYAILFITIGFIPRRPLMAGLFQVGGGFVIFLLTQDIWLKTPGLLIVIGGALALTSSPLKDEDAPPDPDISQM